MPDVTDDERGRRVFQIHKEMAVETALEKIRQSMGQDWKLYSVYDIDILKYMLGERLGLHGSPELGAVHFFQACSGGYRYHHQHWKRGKEREADGGRCGQGDE